MYIELTQAATIAVASACAFAVFAVAFFGRK
jgi:hypothetical protein